MVVMEWILNIYVVQIYLCLYFNALDPVLAFGISMIWRSTNLRLQVVIFVKLWPISQQSIQQLVCVM